MVKLRVFVAILNYLQQIFLNEFLIPEIKRVGKLVGYNEDEIPLPKFVKINLDDPVLANRVWAQLAQLGLLSSQETFDAMETGILPTQEDSIKNQKEYKKNRKDDLFVPLLGGPKEEAVTPPGGRPKGSKKPQKQSSKIGFKGKASIESYQFDIIEFRKNILLANDVTNDLTKLYSKKLGRALEENDTKNLESIATHLITNESPEDWKNKIKSYLKEIPEPNLVNVGLAAEIKEKKEIDDFTAGILIHSLVK